MKRYGVEYSDMFSRNFRFLDDEGTFEKMNTRKKTSKHTSMFRGKKKSWKDTTKRKRQFRDGC